MNLVSAQPNIRVLKDRAAVTLIICMSLTFCLFLLALGLSDSLNFTLYEARSLLASLRSMTHRRPPIVTATCTEVEPAKATSLDPVDLSQTG